MSDIDLPDLDWRVVLNRASPPGRGWGRVRASQIKSVGASLHIAAVAQLMVAAALASALNDYLPGLELVIWLGILALATFIIWHASRGWRRPDLHWVSRQALDRVAYHSVFIGAIWALPATYAFSRVGHPEQLIICVVTVSMMAGATFAFATVPVAAGGYVIVLGTAIVNMLASAGNGLIHLVGFFYTASLFLMIVNNGRVFMRRRCVELALEERTETVSLLLREYEDSDADWLWQTDSLLCLENVSSRFARALGRTKDDLEGRSILALLADDGSTACESVRSSIARRAPFNETVVQIDGPNGVRCIALSALPRYGANNRFIGYRGVGSDVTEARLAADHIQHMARHDTLTGLPNRLQLTEMLSRALDNAGGRQQSCALLLIDLDRFKTVNDALGHVAGDSLLRQVSTRFAPSLASGMTAGRLGGDEFALVVDAQIEREEDVRDLALQIVQAMEQPFQYEDQDLFVGASIGIAFGPHDGTSVEELLRNADLALYEAKGAGGGRVCCYEPRLHERVEQRRRLELAMRTALDNEEFGLVYQPIVDGEGKVTSFETLLRWHNDEMGSVPPESFIPVAEDIGLLGRIGEWVLRQACAEAVHWPRSVGIAVNVSPRQLQDASFPLTLVSALSQSGLEPHRLELELTERVFLNMNANTKRALQQIRALGVRISMDDFGTGYSSLGYLREANFDTLKIDRSFVQSMRADDPGSCAIIRAVVALATSLGMRTVVEGVETAEQLETARRLGCDYAQGFLIAEPLTAMAARDLIGSGRSLAAA